MGEKEEGRCHYEKNRRGKAKRTGTLSSNHAESNQRNLEGRTKAARELFANLHGAVDLRTGGSERDN